MTARTKPYHAWSHRTFQNMGESITWIATFWILGTLFNPFCSIFTAAGFNTFEAVGLVFLTVPLPLALTVSGARAYWKLRTPRRRPFRSHGF